MEYQLDRRLGLHIHPDRQPPENWSIFEVDADGKRYRENLEPYGGYERFTIVSFTLDDRVEVVSASDHPYYLEAKDEDSSWGRSIRARIEPHVDQASVGGGSARYFMLGCDKPVQHFELHVFASTEGKRDECIALGSPPYDSLDLPLGGAGNYISFHFGLSQDKFDKLWDKVSAGRISGATLTVSRVDGFYAKWNSLEGPESIAVLTKEKPHKLKLPDGFGSAPPTLRQVGNAVLEVPHRIDIVPSAPQNDTNANDRAASSKAASARPAIRPIMGSAAWLLLTLAAALVGAVFNR